MASTTICCSTSTSPNDTSIAANPDEGPPTPAVLKSDLFEELSSALAFPLVRIEPPQEQQQQNEVHASSDKPASSSLDYQALKNFVYEFMLKDFLVNTYNFFTDILIDILLYLCTLYFFYIHPLTHKCLLAVSMMLMYLVYIGLYEIYDWKQTKVPWVWRDVGLSMFNITIMCLSCFVVQYLGCITWQKIEHVSWKQILWTPILWLFCDELVFYFVHRISHHPKLYPYIHKAHHKYRNTRPIYTQYNQITETIFMVLASLYAGFLFVRPNIYVFLATLNMLVRHNVSGHRYNPATKTKDASGRHAIHHLDGRYNFGASVIVDLMFNTEFLGTAATK